MAEKTCFSGLTEDISSGELSGKPDNNLLDFSQVLGAQDVIWNLSLRS